MKVKLLLLAAVAAFSSVAQAQSSVTLYGTIDTAVAYFSNEKGTNHSGGTFQMYSGTLTGDNWGLKGNEDLGGGLSAVFKLESGFNVNDGAAGQGGRMFGRTAMVGLADKSYGTVTVGRQYDPLVDLIQPLTEDDTYGSAFATPGDMDNYDNSSRVNNSIKYTSPTYGGLQVSAMYAFGGEAGETSAGQTYAVAAAYGNGPLNLAAGYLRANNDGASSTYDGLTQTGLDSTAINGAFISATTLQIIRAAGTYAIGPVTIGAAYSNVAYGNYAAAAGPNNGTRFNTGQAFVNYQVNATELGIGYNYTKGAGNNVDASYDQLSLGVLYALSKRTDLYALAAYQKASGNTIGASGELVAATASVGDFGNDASTNSQSMVMLGIKHHF